MIFHLSVPNIRDLALSEKLVPILRELLGQVPVLCVSLFFQKGSSQPPHVDFHLFNDRLALLCDLIATWMALEDVERGRRSAGVFSRQPSDRAVCVQHGRLHFVPNEMALWSDYYDKKVKERELKKVAFNAKKGDVFIWHSDLLHGGAAIRNPALTRKSLVFHYYSESDCRAPGTELVQKVGGILDQARPSAGSIGQLMVSGKFVGAACDPGRPKLAL